MKGHTLKCPKCDHSFYIFYMSEGEVQNLTGGEIVTRLKKRNDKDRNFFEVIQETARLVKELKTK